MNFKEYKSLDYAQVAEETLKFWKENNIFEKSIEVREGKQSFTFYEGPPSANGTPGIHHVMARTIKDIFCRYKTLRGYQVKRKGGWDTHGLPIELQVEKELGITKDDIGNRNAESYISIEDYNKKCREAVMRFTDLWQDMTDKMGYWVDMNDPYITYKNEYIESIWYLLKKFYEKGLLYKGFTIQPYSPAAGTGLSSHELNQPGCYKDVKDTTIVAMFKVLKGQSHAFAKKLETLNHELETYILAWTTTPWTLPANSALTVGANITYALVKTFNPYTYQPVNVILAKDLIGKYFSEKGREGDFEGFEASDKKIIPFSIIAEFKGSDLEGVQFEQLIPAVTSLPTGEGLREGSAFRVIVGDFVTTEDGTGVVHTSPTFGADDFRVAKQNGVPPIMVADETGKEVPVVDKKGRFVSEVGTWIATKIEEYGIKTHKTFGADDFYVKNYLGEDEKQTNYKNTDEIIAIILKSEGKAFKVEKYEHTYPHCWRTDKPVLYYPLDSWFIRTTAMKDQLVALNKTINWQPASTGTGRFGNWLENLVDWNLSRSRYWGTPLPIWRSEDGEEVCIGSTEELVNGIKNALKSDVLNEEQREKNEAFLYAYEMNLTLNPSPQERDFNLHHSHSNPTPSPVERGTGGEVEQEHTWESFVYQSNYKDWEELKNFVRDNRKNSTEAENVLWQALRNRKLDGQKFRRQHTIDTFIVDFVNIENKLIIEIDGLSHENTEKYDLMRTKFLESRGFKVIRFKNEEVLTNVDEVCFRISSTINNFTLNPSPQERDSNLSISQQERNLNPILSPVERNTKIPPSPVERGTGGEVQFDLHRPYVDEVYLVSSSGKVMQREPDLIDVWFDSGAMPYAQWHYPFDPTPTLPNREGAIPPLQGEVRRGLNTIPFPADFISEGVDQTRGWFFTLHAIAGMLFDSVAFKNVVSTGLVLDKNGNKMSKRLGNAVDPFETLKKYGADPTRWYMITNAEPWDNLKFNLDGVVEVQRKFFGTLTNTYNFFALYANLDNYRVEQFDRVPKENLTELDRWIISKVFTLVKRVSEEFDNYNPTKAGRLIQDFVCDDLSNWYVRLNRRRFWQGEMTDDKRAAYQTLQHCLCAVSQLMSPIAPFYADWLYKNLTEHVRQESIEKNTPFKYESVHFTEWHTYEPEWVDTDLEESMTLAQNICSMVHALRKKSSLKVRQPLQKILIPVLSAKTREQIEHIASIIMSEVNVKSVEFIDEDSATSVGGILKKKVKPNFKNLGPKYGKDMKMVAESIQNMTAEQLKQLEKEKQFQIPNSEFLIALDDVEILTEDIPGWLVAVEGGLTVALDINVTDDLRQEGIARDFINRIQNQRKDNGYEVTDKIRIQLQNNNEELATAVATFRDYICEEVQALSLEVTTEKPTNAHEIEMDEFNLVVGLEVA